MGKYVLKNAAGGQFMFNLLAGNNQVILTSETYTSKAAARTGIASVQKNCQIDARYERRQSVRNEPYFVLKAAQGEIIGRSEMYSSVDAMEKGIQSVKTNGPTTAVDDRTT